MTVQYVVVSGTFVFLIRKNKNKIRKICLKLDHKCDWSLQLNARFLYSNAVIVGENINVFLKKMADQCFYSFLFSFNFKFIIIKYSES